MRSSAVRLGDEEPSAIEGDFTACAGGPWSRWAGFGGEGHLDRLLGAAFFLLGQVGQGALVEVGERGLEQVWGHRRRGADDVDLGGIQGELCPRYS
jgi:hypothetical protein